MPSNDKPVNGHDNPSFLDLLNQLPPEPPAPAPHGRHASTPLASLRAAWKESWEEGGFLYRRWEEVLKARHGSWHEAATQIKTAPPARRTQPHRPDAGRRQRHRLWRPPQGPVRPPRHPGRRRSDRWGTVDHPVRIFLANQAAHLPVTPAAL
ncbi:hypothetical protein [Streptomyces vinaceus]|uniref:hypothetical protein n=1 Tax=Streptomyces vinaceus TaxID=1960 RepID=UPI0019BA31BB|nr:hypothetical protein [Streptomyces vinaceus]GHE73787.1 hypothetical protein GCM10017778_68940 [Streptomyces vinaceus]